MNSSDQQKVLPLTQLQSHCYRYQVLIQKFALVMLYTVVECFCLNNDVSLQIIRLNTLKINLQ